MRILVTGGCGFIGFNLVNFLKLKYSESVKIDIIDNLSRSGSINNHKILKNRNFYDNFYKVDCSNEKKLLFCLKNKNYDYIFHFAAQVAVTSSIIDPIKDYKANFLSTFNILNYLRLLKKNKPTLVFSSTNKVYGNLSYLKLIEQKFRYKSNPKTIDESFRLDFNTPYGCSKGASDQYITDFSKIYNFKSIVLRLSCIYGTYQNGIEDQGWINWIVKNILKDNKINIYGNGKQVRDILYIQDLCNLFDKIINSGSKISSDSYNVGGSINNSISLLDLINILKKEKYDCKISYKNWRNDDQKYYVSNISKVSKKFKWSPKITPEIGIKEMISWLKENKNKKYLI